MSLFADLNAGAIKGPDVQMNVGPLPSVAGGPEGSNGDPDGRINFNSSLLEGIQPYAYGEAARMGSDRNYQQIPHRIQQIIPMLYLPHADKEEKSLVHVSHAVDVGDVAFIVGTNHVQSILFDGIQQQDATILNSEMPARNAFCNLSTVNYLLAGLQRLNRSDPGLIPWQTFAKSIGFHPTSNKEELLLEVRKVMRTGFVPFGICSGSEHQGGKHETGLAPVQAAVNHVTTMTIDGQNRDLVNFWRRHDCHSGDQLIYRLELLPTKRYTLNHYYKGVVHQTFPADETCWQIVPDVFRIDYKNQFYENAPRLDGADVYDYRLHGYWRIGQMMHHRAKTDLDVSHYSNDLTFMRGQLLHITFAPVWVQHEDLITNEPGICVEIAPERQSFKMGPTKKKARLTWSVPLENNQSDDETSVPHTLCGMRVPAAHVPRINFAAKMSSVPTPSVLSVLESVENAANEASESDITDDSKVVKKVKMKQAKKSH